MDWRLSGTRRAVVAFAAVAGLSLVSVVGGPVRAQEATPAAMGPACTAVLGIGAEGDACVNIVHASPDAPAVDIYVDGAKAVEKLAFGKATGWVALPAGEHQVQVAPAGEAADKAVIDATLDLTAGMAYEAAAVGNVAEIKAAVFPVDLTVTEDAANAAVRVIHASPDAPAVDVAVKGGDVLIANLAFPDASDYLTVPAGTYDLEVRPTGTTDVALDLPGVELTGGDAYSVYAIGTVAAGTLTVLPIVAGAPMAEAAQEATPSA
ncbi:MAG: DUF4397 domain-containing protein [Thermomicrobiales bacterium]